jgi:plastocyanin
MRNQLLAVVAIGAVAALAVPAALAETTSIKVDDNYYMRSAGTAAVAVDRGDTVRWNFVGRSPHTVSARGPARIESGPMTSGTFRRKLTTPGRYRIFCRVHGAKDMSMILVVRDNAASRQP